MTNILELIKQDGFTFKKVASTKGGVWKGACPWCGGSDRFSIYPEEKGGRYICNQCPNRGDAIQYLRDYKKYSYQEACNTIGIQPNREYKPLRPTTPFESAERNQWEPRKVQAPEELWQEKAAAVLFGYYKFMLSAKGSKHRSWLNERGINNQTIKTARLGWNSYSANFDRQSFGLPIERNQKTGKSKTVWIPEGLIIPYFKNDKVARLRIRQNKPISDDRYIIAPGSFTGYFQYPGIVPGRSSIVVEAELDGWLIWQEAGDLINVFAIGNSSARPDVETDKILSSSKSILACLDFDSAGLKEQEWWDKNYNAVPWVTPVDKDPGEAYKAGLNIRDWIKAGLAETANHNTPVELKPEPRPEKKAPVIKPVEEDTIPVIEAEPERKMKQCLHGKFCNNQDHHTCLIQERSIFVFEICPKSYWKAWIEGNITQIILLPMPRKRH